MTQQPQLQPVPRPWGVFDQFIARNTETLILKERVFSLTGDSFDVRTANGQPVFKIQGRKMTISGRKSLSDMQGNHLFDIVQERMHIHTTYVAEDPRGNKILTVRNSIRLIGSKATVEIHKANDGQTHTLTMSGNWRDTRADIVDQNTGAVVARIDRRLLNTRELLGGKQTYALSVAAGVDMALMVAACVALDEKNND
ncbi:Protein LURP-one-related-like protein [Hapsidospora chrysogenum ATCC 11550]|uniref:Protein LURP-one-related-like protein n=1 Tax=Hapsidospora chrysogenum (strain ATCC 11550 / CBS 779.69 / DSM 880 / IAM 14645 / JCM 23072 / IMI 49137) TaxID=857340 RepID=A0A086SYA3_HAPC1|nr:Protein LURP-one-related-like protein [Hapsidospora chrysogenum ATCC 11550]